MALLRQTLHRDFPCREPVTGDGNHDPSHCSFKLQDQALGLSEEKVAMTSCLSHSPCSISKLGFFSVRSGYCYCNRKEIKTTEF